LNRAFLAVLPHGSLISGLVLFVGDVFEPVYGFAVQAFLDCDVGHGGGGCGSVPVFFVWGEPDYVAGVDLFYWAAFALGSSAACGDDQGLAEGVGVPGGAGSGLECDAGAGYQGWVGCLKEWVDTYGSGEPVCWTFT
jgi:hypothetical protein